MQPDPRCRAFSGQPTRDAGHRQLKPDLAFGQTRQVGRLSSVVPFRPISGAAIGGRWPDAIAESLRHTLNLVSSNV